MVMVAPIQEIFTMIFLMAKALSSMWIRINIMVILEKEKNKEKETIILAKELYLVEHGKMMKKFKDS